mgnify:CR=1 FL=1
MDQDKVEIEAKKILDKFAKALEIVKTKEDFYVDRDKFEREENGINCNDFKPSLLENAQKKDNDFIISEKGNWK